MSILTEGNHTGEFLLSEANGTQSREEVTFAALTAALVSGTVVAKIAKGTTATSAANAGNTGTGTMGTVTVTAGTANGIYNLRITGEAANAGNFVVEGPDGKIVGTGKVATAFSKGGLAFTLADATDFVVGDGFTITVAAGTGKWAAYDDTHVNGTEIATGVLYTALPINTGDQSGVVIARNAEVASARLTGSDAAAVVDLAALGIIVRS